MSRATAETSTQAQHRNTFALLARHAYSDFASDMPANVRTAAIRCLIDWFGLVLGGVRERPTQMIIAAAKAEHGPSAVPGLPAVSLPASTAALLMGTASHVLDYDDTDYVNLIHVSSTLLPALFAVAGELPLSGRALLQSFAASYEAEDRYGFYLGRKLTACGWHVSGIIGHLGSALACSLARQLSVETAEQAMAISSTGASGFIAAFGTMSKPLQLGRSAAAGVMASALAREGFDGPIESLNQAPGLLGPLIGETIGDWSHIDEAWGQPHAILRNSFKPHASCMITHPIVDAAIALMSEHKSIAIDKIASIECHVNPLAPKVAGNPHPTTGLEGKFSVAYCAIMGLLYGRATPDRFTAELTGQAQVQSLLKLVKVQPSASVGEQSARIIVHLDDGTVHSHFAAIAKGNPDNPMTDRDIEQKFEMLAAPFLKSTTQAVLDDLRNFESIPDVAGWISRVNAGAQEPQ